jgi:Helix-turn-helix of DDE superfamily endonuclease
LSAVSTKAEALMFYHKVKLLKAQHFRRLTGVQKGTFAKMVKEVKAAEAKKRWHGGRPPKLSVENRLLMMLMYWRENRTYFHIAQAYGVNEGACWRMIAWLEQALIKSGSFRLPGKKALLKEEENFEVVLIDATETPIERPKKNSAVTIPERKSDTR